MINSIVLLLLKAVGTNAYGYTQAAFILIHAGGIFGRSHSAAYLTPLFQAETWQDDDRLLTAERAI